MKRLSTSSSTVAAVTTVSPPTDLVHDTTYTLAIEYRDRAPNPATSVNVTGLLFDILTEPFTFKLPAADTIIKTVFDLTFEIPEVALQDSVILTVTFESGVNDPNSPHKIVLPVTAISNSYAFTTGTFSLGTSAGAGMPWAASVTNPSGAGQDLVDGATYTMNMEYQDAIGNTKVEIAHSNVFFAGNATLAPIFSRPMENVRLPQQFVIDFTLIEPALAGSLTMTFTPNAYGISNDPHGSRVILFDTSFETAGRHQIVAGRLSELASTAGNGVQSVTPATDLVNDASYDVLLSYRDSAGHAVSTVAHHNVTFDTETKPPTLVRPVVQSRAKVAFALEFTLPEEALAGSLKLVLKSMVNADPGAANDGTDTRTIRFAESVNQAGTYSFLMTNLSLAASNVANIASVTPAEDLVHGVKYIFTVQYRDHLGNDQADDESSNVLFDTFTITPTFSLPAASSYVRVDWPLSFTLPEPALAGSVTLLISPTSQSTRFGSPDDDKPPLLVTFGTEFESENVAHAIAGMSQVSMAATALSAIVSVVAVDANTLLPLAGVANASRDLKHGAVYDYTLSYRDQAENTPAVVQHAGIYFDVRTETPTLHKPVKSTFLLDSFNVTFTLPEDASPGTVLLKIVPTNVGQTDNAGTRTITMSSALEGEGSKHFMLGPLSTAADPSSSSGSSVASVSPATDLVDGCVYEFLIEYRDVAQNTRAFDEALDVAFASTATLPPTLSTPSAASSVRSDFDINFAIREQALPGSLQILLKPVSSSNNVPDAHGDRVVVLSSALETRGSHLFQLYNLSVAAALSEAVTSVNPPVDLIVGAVYDFLLSYQDAAGNSRESVSATQIAFAGNATLAPTLLSPQTLDFVGETFPVQFVIPENPLDDTVVVTFEYDTSVSIVVDGISTRTVTFDSSQADANGNPFNAAGSFTVNFRALSNVDQLASVKSCSPAQDLIDGAVYTMTLSYQDAAGNLAATASQFEVSYVGIYTVAPALHVPSANARIPERFAVDFTITEFALSSSVFLSFIPMFDDSYPQRDILLSSVFERPGRYNFTMEKVATSNVTMSEVRSVACSGITCVDEMAEPVDLINDATYRIMVKYKDRAGNPGTDGLPFGRTQNQDIVFDDVMPFVASTGAVVLNLSTGLMTVNMSEMILVNASDPAENWYGHNLNGVDLTKFFLSQSSGGNEIALGGVQQPGGSYAGAAFHLRQDSSVTLSATGVYGEQLVSIRLTEQQRIDAILGSDTPGGDDSPLVLDVYAYAVRDLATNPLGVTTGTAGRDGDPTSSNLNRVILEIADTIPPQLSAAQINLSTGVVVVVFFLSLSTRGLPQMCS